MTCQQCGTENPPGNRFCMKCGADLMASGTADAGAEGAESTAGTFTAGAEPGQPDYTGEPQPMQGGYSQTGQAQPGYTTATGQSGGYSPPYSTPTNAPPNPAMVGQGYAVQGQPGMVWSQDQLVGFGPRLGAFLIDWVILVIIGAILNAIRLGGLDFLVGILYYGYFWGTTGQSLGMKALNIKVVRADGQPMSYVLGAVRYICYIVSAIPIFLGFLWIIWDAKKQGFHDKIVGTVVVRA